MNILKGILYLLGATLIVLLVYCIKIWFKRKSEEEQEDYVLSPEIQLDISNKYENIYINISSILYVIMFFLIYKGSYLLLFK